MSKEFYITTVISLILFTIPIIITFVLRNKDKPNDLSYRYDIIPETEKETYRLNIEIINNLKIPICIDENAIKDSLTEDNTCFLETAFLQSDNNHLMIKKTTKFKTPLKLSGNRSDLIFNVKIERHSDEKHKEKYPTVKKSKKEDFQIEIEYSINKNRIFSKKKNKKFIIHIVFNDLINRIELQYN